MRNCKETFCETIRKPIKQIRFVIVTYIELSSTTYTDILLKKKERVTLFRHLLTRLFLFPKKLRSLSYYTSL